MFVGHNFDSVAGYNQSFNKGIENFELPTWRGMKGYMFFAAINPLDCFFTNLYMGLKPGSALGKLEATDRFKDQCITFLAIQIAEVRPKLIVAMKRDPVHLAMQIVETRYPVCKVIHPSGARRVSIQQREAAKIRRALDELGVPMTEVGSSLGPGAGA